MAAEDKDLHRDPLTDEPGSHPVGTSVGAAGGAIAGAAAGSAGGPVGAAVGGAVGAIAGGLAGRASAEAVNPSAEEAHWREHYTREPYYEPGRTFDDYAPAYRLGLSGRTRYEGDWLRAEPRLASEWEAAHGSSSLSWPQARSASHAAWDRIDASRSGETDWDRMSEQDRMNRADERLATADSDASGGDPNRPRGATAGRAAQSRADPDAARPVARPSPIVRGNRARRLKSRARRGRRQRLPLSRPRDKGGLSYRGGDRAFLW